MGRMALWLSGAAVGMIVAAVLAGSLADIPGSLVSAHREPPVSSMEPLPEYVRSQVVYANFTSYSKQGRIVWTELWYQKGGSGYAMYAPPWNSDGHWLGSPVNDPDDHDDDGRSSVHGTVPFDTFFTGGEGAYDFYTIAVATKHMREKAPERPKASTVVDATAPEVSVSHPLSGSWTITAEVEWSATDAASGVKAVTIALDGSSVGTVHPAKGRLPLAGLAPGGHGLKVTAADRAGNARAALVPFSFDPNAPAVEFASPSAGAYLSSRAVSVSWTAHDTTSGIDRFLFVFDSGSVIVLPALARLHVLEAVAEGTHTVSLTAVDTAGNSAYATVSFTVDATPPVIAVLSPRDGEFLSGTQLAILWSSDDAISGVIEYRLALDLGAPVTVSRAGAYTFPSVGEGLHTVTVTAVDRAGNEGRVRARAVLDATPPAVSVLRPSSGSSLTGSVRVSWQAADTISGIAKVELALDGATPIDATHTSAYTYPAPALGPHALTLRAIDRAGNEAEVIVPFSAVSVPPSPAGVPPGEFWAIIAIMAIAGFTFWAVRQRARGAGGR